MDSFRRSLLLVSFALVLPACKKKDSAVRGSGVGSTKSRTVGAFTALKVTGGLDFVVSVGKNAPLEITGDDNLLAHVTSKLEGSTLLLGIDTKLRVKQPLRVRVGTERLERFMAGPGTRGSVEGVKSDVFDLEATGGAKVTVSGSSRALKVESRGPTRLDLSGFSAQQVTVGTSDVSSVDLGYLEELDATLSGMSRVTYVGEPKIKENVTKPARLSRRE